MQEVVKLIMNSAYGKSIQKPIKTDLRFVSADKVQYKLFDCYHQIVKAEPIHCAFGSVQPDVKAEPIGEGAATNWLFEMFKRRSNQFNNAIFGITVLSISKRIMNEVMCLAEDMGIEIYYQDTDSMHIEWDRVDDLDREFTKKYGRKLIGSDMGNFHTDFSPADAYCVRHISLGKKMYLDVLESPTSGRHLHIRMKGIPEQVIKNHAEKYFKGSVEALYEHIYNGGNVEFNLLDGKVCMKASRAGTIEYVPKFSRNVRPTASLH